MARITKLFPGSDGHVRSVEVKTSSGTLVRPISKLYPLEVESELDGNIEPNPDNETVVRPRRVAASRALENIRSALS